jgi:hypothetical protein
LLEPDAWKAGTSGSEGAPAQQCAGATRRWRIQRHRKRGTAEHFVYTYPSKTSLGKVKAKVKTLSRQERNEPLSELLRRINPVLRGWTTTSVTGCPRLRGWSVPLAVLNWQTGATATALDTHLRDLAATTGGRPSDYLDTSDDLFAHLPLEPRDGFGPNGWQQ